MGHETLIFSNVSNLLGLQGRDWKMNSQDIDGKEVLGSNGWKVGKAKDLTFDEKSWRVSSLDVELDRDVAKEFDLKGHFHKTHVAVNVSYVHAIGDSVILNASKEELFRLMSTGSNPTGTTSASQT